MESIIKWCPPECQFVFQYVWHLCAWWTPWLSRIISQSQLLIFHFYHNYKKPHDMCELHVNYDIIYQMLWHLCVLRSNVLAVDIYFETFRYEELFTEASYVVSSWPIHPGKITEISGNFVIMKCWEPWTHTCIQTFRHTHIFRHPPTFDCTRYNREVGFTKHQSRAHNILA